MDLKETIGAISDMAKNIDVEQVKKQVKEHKDDIANVIDKTPLKEHKDDIMGFAEKILGK